MQTQIYPFANVDRQWLATSLERGRSICTHYSVESGIDAGVLDRVFALWAGSAARTQDFSNDEVANGLGSLFGELLQRSFKFSWVQVEDDYGREPALLEETTGSIVMPVNAVYKRIEPELQPQPFFLPMWQMIAAHLEKSSN
jgi:hypothetical protein